MTPLIHRFARKNILSSLLWHRLFNVELSRGIEESVTLISPLIPWNAGGAFVISALGLADGNIENLLYIPLAFDCWTAPLIEIFMLLLGYSCPK